MIRAAAVTSGFYYLSKTLSADKELLQRKLQCFKPQVVYAESERDLPSQNLLLKETSHLTAAPGCLWDGNWDKRAPLGQTNDDAQRTLLFIRHGDYDSRGENKGHLNTKGREEVNRAAIRLNALFTTGTIAKVFHSTVMRAEESYNIIRNRVDLSGTVVESSDFIREGYPGPPEPFYGSEKPPHVAFQDRAQMEAGFRRIFYRPPQSQRCNTNEIYVCHANLIRYFVMRANQVPESAWGRLHLDNGSFTEFKIRGNGRIKTLSIGERGHIGKIASNC